MNKHARFVSSGFKLAVVALAVFGAGSAMAVTTSATSTGVIVTPINITKNADLSFGNITGGTGGGTVTLSPNATRAYTGTALAVGAGAATAAQFTVTGQAGLTYSVSFAGTSSSLSDGASHTMTFSTISDHTASAITTGNVTAGTLTGGTESIYVGGVLTVGASQVAGTYSGTISVAVDYN